MIIDKKLDLNFLEIETIQTIKSMINDSHYIDIIVRHNGQDKLFEADFLKKFLRKIDL